MTQMDPFNPMPPRHDTDRERHARPDEKVSLGWAGVLVILLAGLVIVALAAA